MKYLLFGLLIVSSLGSRAQDAEADTTLTPFDLITNYYNSDTFRPFQKGNGYLGLAFTLEDQSLQNTQRLFDKVTNGDQIDWQLTFKGGYFLWDYVQVGMNVIYGRNEFDGQLIDQNSDSVRRASVSSSGAFVPFIKIYFPVSRNERLSFFLENGVGLGFGTQLQRDTRDTDQITKRYSEEFVFSLGLSPGITFFAVENFAFEIQLSNLLGYEYTRRTTSIDDLEESVKRTNNVNFSINLLSLRLGLAYYFNKLH